MDSLKNDVAATIDPPGDERRVFAPNCVSVQRLGVAAIEIKIGRDRIGLTNDAARRLLDKLIDTLSTLHPDMPEVVTYLDGDEVVAILPTTTEAGDVYRVVMRNGETVDVPDAVGRRLAFEKTSPA